MFRLVSAGIALLLASIIYFFILLRRKRKEMEGLPQPPMQSWLWGHLPIAGECQELFPQGIHAHNFGRYIQKKYELGTVFYLDWWPLGPRWLFMSDPELINQHVTTAQNLPKSCLETEYLDTFLGAHNMVSVEGQQWKNLRTMFNPGFSSAHLMTLVPYIVDSSLVFCNVIQKKAESNELFELEEYGTRLTIDIIGKVVLDSDFDSQKQVHPIVETFRKRVLYMPGPNPIAAFRYWFEFRRRWKLYRNGVKLDSLIGDELDRKMASRAASSAANGTASKPSSSFKDRKRSVIDLALDAYQKEFASTTAKNAPMDSTFRTAAIDSMKTFIFAGHDTTASTIAYVFYLLHFHPSAHRRLVDELDSVFGANVSTQHIAEKIKTDPHIVNKLEYTTAVIKETLRIFPPASTLRYIQKPGFTFPDPADPSRQLPLSDFHVWPIVHLVSRNEKFFPRPTEFIPERFIQSLTPFDNSECALFSSVGKDAFRAFEKGPRACIGEQLAMLETRIILALTVREFDFVCEFDGTPVKVLRSEETAVELPRRSKEGGEWTVEGHKPWQILKGTAKPRGGMPGRMSLRKG
jgi:cytochrome P450